MREGYRTMSSIKTEAIVSSWRIMICMTTGYKCILYYYDIKFWLINAYSRKRFFADGADESVALLNMWALIEV